MIPTKPDTASAERHEFGDDLPQTTNYVTPNDEFRAKWIEHVTALFVEAGMPETYAREKAWEFQNKLDADFKEALNGR